MKNLLFVLTTVSLLFTSCSGGYEEQSDEIFDDKIWTKGEEAVFHPLIGEGNMFRNISLDVQHVYGYDISALDVNVVFTAPSGNVELEKSYTIQFKDVNGNGLSDCSGDYCDLTQVLEPHYEFKENGEYRIAITQNSHAESVAGFLSLKLKMKSEAE